MSDIATVVKQHENAVLATLHITYFTARFQCCLKPAQIRNMLNLFFLKHKGNRYIAMEKRDPLMQFILEDYANVAMQQIATEALSEGIITAEEHVSYAPYFKRSKYTIADPVHDDYIVITL